MKVQILFAFLILTLVFSSCDEQEFIKTKNANKEVHSLDGSSSIKIKSYQLTYNPKSNGFIKIELESGAKYEAKSVEGGSFSSINSLLQDPNVLFDTMRKEVVITKTIQN